MVITRDPAKVYDYLGAGPGRSGATIGRRGAIIVDVPSGVISKLARLEGVSAVLEYELPQPVDSNFSLGGGVDPGIRAGELPEPGMWRVVKVQGAEQAWSYGFNGSGVNVAVLDTGVDFGHPDLDGVQARVTNVSSPYYGWPIAFDPRSMRDYLSSGLGFPSSDNWYSDTSLTDTDANSDGILDSTGWNVAGIVSVSGTYHYGIHPDDALRWIQGISGGAKVLVVDENLPGKYDTVYVDLNDDDSFADEKPARRGDETITHDLDGNGIADLSGGLVYFIADGVTPIPYSDVFSASIGVSNIIPTNGDLVAFMINNPYEAGGIHGTLCASAVAAQGRISSGVVIGTAPGARIIPVGNIYQGGSFYDSFFFAVEGYDGVPGTGDEAQVLSNSWGFSDVINKGWTYDARLADEISAYYAPKSTFVVASGNGGFGYGTVVSPGSSPGVITVGAATNFWWESSFATQTDAISWTDRGPSALGQIEPDVLSVGAYATGDVALNYLFPANGTSAWGLWGGTSLATPVTAGIVAIVYQAYKKAHSTFPDSALARNILMSGADDLHYDPFVQGAGLANASRSSLIASERSGILTSPSFWTVGDYRGTHYEAFANIVFPGDSHTKVFDVRNADQVNATTAFLNDVVMKRIDGYNMTIFSDLNKDNSNQGTVDHLIPLIDKKSGISDIPNNTELVRVTLSWDYATFDEGWDYSYNSRFYLYAYNWKDIDGDGRYWNDLNSDGIIQSNEIEASPELEIVTLNSATQCGDTLELRAHDPFARIDDGLIIGISRIYRTGLKQSDVQLNLTVQSFATVDCPWLSLNTSVVSLVPGGSSSFNLTASVPANADYGTYQAEIVVAEGSERSVIPIVFNVASNEPRFSWGNHPQDDDLYLNDRVLGGFNWNWRYESGDWRFFFMEVPDSYFVGSGTRMFVNVTWDEIPTDIDVFILGNATDQFSIDHPDRYGPYTMDIRAMGSVDYGGGGLFRFSTTTGGPQEILTSELCAGLNEIVLHNTLNSGNSAWNRMRGEVGVLKASPYPWHLGTVTDFSLLKGTQEFTVLSTLNLSDVQVSAFGVSQPIDLADQTIYQDNPMDPSTSSWSQELIVQNGGYIRSKIDSTNPIDIDLYLVYDMNSNGLPDWPQEILESSLSPDASEEVMHSFPSDGRYWVFVHGWNIPGGSSLFDISIEVVEGNDLVEKDVPTGPLPKDTQRFFNVTYDIPALAGHYIGGVLVGPSIAQDAVIIPFSVDIREIPPEFSNFRPPENSYINTNQPTIGVDFSDTGSGINYSSIVMKVDQVDVTNWSTVSSNSIIWVMPFLLGEGLHTVYVSVADNSSNRNSTTWSFVVDTVPPLLEIDKPIDGLLTNDVNIQVSGRSEPGVDLRLNGSPIPVLPNGTFNGTIVLPVGDNYLRFVATDLAGNNKTVSRRVTVDITPPLLVVYNPINGTVTNAHTILVNGTTEPTARVSVGGQLIIVEPNGYFETLVALSEGENNITIVSEDLAGNFAMEVLSVELDTNAPLLSVFYPEDGFVTSSDSIEVSGLTEVGANLTVDGRMVQVQPDGTFRENISLLEGPNLIKLVAVDKATNRNTVTLVVLKDTISPFLSLESPLDGLLTNESAVLVSGSTESGASVTANGYSVEVDAFGNFSIVLVLPEGTNNVLVRSTDEAGNFNTISRLVTVDTTPPILVIDEPVDGLVTNRSTVHLSGMTEIGASVSALGTSIAVQPDGRFSTWLPLVPGVNEINVIATDFAGNRAEDMVKVTMDNQPPPLLIFSPANNSLVNESVVTVEGSTEYGSTLSVGGILAVVELDGTFGLPISLKEGENEILIWARDQAGNEKRERLILTVDMTPPVLNVTSPRDGLVTNEDVVVSGTTEPGATLDINGMPAQVGADGTFSMPFSLVEGSNLIEIETMDTAFNKKSVVLTVYLDKAAPRLQVTSPSDGEIVGQPFILISGRTEWDAHLSVNNQSIDLDPVGYFEALVPLQEGENSLHIVASDEAGNRNATKIDVFADLTPPVADAGPDQRICRGSMAKLNASRSEDDVSVESYEWRFYNGETYVKLVGKTRNYTFSNEGNFEITLIVTDEVGNKGIDTVWVFVSPTGDIDSDGLQDGWEMENFGNLDKGGLDDPDNDRLTNLEEQDLNTDPNKKDTDGDGLIDGLDDDPLNPSEKASTLADYWLVILVIAIIVDIAITSFFLLRLRRRPPTLQAPAEEGATPPDEDNSAAHLDER